MSRQRQPLVTRVAVAMVTCTAMMNQPCQGKHLPDNIYFMPFHFRDNNKDKKIKIRKRNFKKREKDSVEADTQRVAAFKEYVLHNSRTLFLLFTLFCRSDVLTIILRQCIQEHQLPHLQKTMCVQNNKRTYYLVKKKKIAQDIFSVYEQSQYEGNIIVCKHKTLHWHVYCTMQCSDIDG